MEQRVGDGRRRAAVGVRVRERRGVADAQRVERDGGAAQHEVQLDQLAEGEEDALLSLREEPEAPHCDRVGAAHLQPLHEEAPPLADGALDGEPRRRVHDAHLRAVDVCAVLASHRPADSGGGDALRAQCGG